MKTLIAIPCMDLCHTDFVRALLSLDLSEAGEVQFTFAQSSLIYDARNKLAGIAVEGGFDRVLWLDSDMIFAPDLYKRLAEHLTLGREFVSGLYFTRRQPIKPVLYKDLRFENLDARWPTPVAESYDDYPRDELFPVKGCGFGAVMMTVDLLRRVAERFGQPFTPVSGWGEDLSFCLRASELGTAIWCDSSIKCGHVGLALYNEDSYRACPT